MSTQASTYRASLPLVQATISVRASKGAYSRAGKTTSDFFPIGYCSDRGVAEDWNTKQGNMRMLVAEGT